jgi:hypothetical protein
VNGARMLRDYGIAITGFEGAGKAGVPSPYIAHSYPRGVDGTFPTETSALVGTCLGQILDAVELE